MMQYLNENQVHLWRLSFAELQKYLSVLVENLTAEELERSLRFKHANDVSRYQLCRGMLRKILSMYLGQAPKLIAIKTADLGKPFISDSKLKFNVSHARDYALIAISYHDVGVDIELSDRKTDMLQIAQRFFSASECQAILKQNKTAQRAFIYQLWCCKEAFVKAIGQGISFGFDTFDVELKAGSATLSSISNAAYDIRDWTLLQLRAPAHYAAALAVKASSTELISYDAINCL